MSKSKLRSFSSQTHINEELEKYKEGFSSHLSDKQMLFFIEKVVDLTSVPLGKNISLSSYHILKFAYLVKDSLKRDYTLQERKKHFAQQGLIELYFLNRGSYDYLSEYMKESGIQPPNKEDGKHLVIFVKAVINDLVPKIVNTVVNSISYADKVDFERKAFGSQEKQRM